MSYLNKAQEIPANLIGQPSSSFIVYDDLQISGANITRPGGDDPTWRTYDFGLGGPAFSVLGFALNDYADFWVQTSHAQKLSTELHFHLHYTIPSDDAAKNIKFQLDVIAAGVDVDFAATAGSPFSAEFALAGTEAAHHNVQQVAVIDAVNTTVSTLYACRLTRVAASADDYGSEVYVLYADCHYQKDMIGSRQEYSKT